MSISSVVHFGRANPALCTLFNFETDKTIYYYDESIEIITSWELQYDDESEISFVQIQIFDKSDISLWNSTEYNETGSFNINLYVNINNLGLNLINGPENISIRFYYFLYEISSGNESALILDEIKVLIKDNTFYWNLITFFTDKPIYYENESIEISTTYELSYDLITDVAFIQVQIFNNTGTLVWNSSEYFDRGVFTRTWNLSIQTLNLTIFGENLTLELKIYLFYYKMGFPMISGLLDEIPIIIIAYQSSPESENPPNNDLNGIPDLTISFGMYYLIIMGAFAVILFLIQKMKIVSIACET